jgi:hypothetical protein
MFIARRRGLAAGLVIGAAAASAAHAHDSKQQQQQAQKSELLHPLLRLTSAGRHLPTEFC